MSDQVPLYNIPFGRGAGSSGFGAIPPGTLGQVLTSQGPGAPASFTAAGSGDMLKSVYDPNNVGMDVFGRGIPVRFATDIPSMTIPAVVLYLRTSGYDTVGKGEALYEYVGSTPGHSFYQTSANGRNFQVSTKGAVNPYMIGATGGNTGDDTIPFQNTFNSMDVYKNVEIPCDTFIVQCGITVVAAKANNGRIHFNNSILKILDTGPNTYMRDGVTFGKIGIYFNAIVGLEITGSAQYLGQGTLGTTSLAGLVFEKCNYLKDHQLSFYDTLAAGRFVFWTDYSSLSGMITNKMNGKQTFENPPTNTQGSADVVVGCRKSIFGAITANANYKPIRYLSTQSDEAGVKYNCEDCYFGWVEGTSSVPASTEGSVCSIRAAVRCTFAGGSGDGQSVGFYVVRYTGEIAGAGSYAVDDIQIGAITGIFVSTAASSDSALQVYSDDNSTLPIGNINIGTINAVCSGETGIIATAGRISIDNLLINGAERSIFAINCTLDIKNIEAIGQTLQMCYIGQGVSVSFGNVVIRSGPVTNTSGAIVYDPASGTGGRGNISIGSITYGKGGSAGDYLYVFFDSGNSFENTQIYNIVGSGTLGQARFGADLFDVSRGQYKSTQAPTSQAYLRGSQVWNNTPSAGGTPGWVCTTAGTPGTWKAMASLAP